MPASCPVSGNANGDESDDAPTRCALAFAATSGSRVRLPYAQLFDLVKRGELARVQPPNVRRIYLVRADLERKLELWKSSE